MKKRRILTFLVVLFLTIILPLAWQNIGSAQSNNLTISAAISLKDALEEIKTLYEKNAANIKITYNFGSSGSLQQQIEQGAPVDIFISAASQQIDALADKNLLLNNSRRNLLTNQLVLITPKNQNNISKIEDLTLPQVKQIAIGDPKTVPAGKYANEVFKYYQLIDALQPKIIYANNVRQVLTYVETGNVDAGFVYLTDAKQSTEVRIAAEAPAESHQPIIYPLAIIKDTKNTTEAKAFVQFLLSNSAKEIFKKYGFGI